MMKKLTVGVIAILAMAVMVDVVFALPCARSSRGGDFNGDGFVSMLDIVSLAINWLGGNCSDSNWCDCADLDISGDVDMTDLKLLAGDWLADVEVFDGTVILGKPTESSVTASVLSDEELDICLQYGTTSGVYTDRTEAYTIQPGIPLELVVQGLQPNTQYYYRINYRHAGEGQFSSGREYRFHTQRRPGSTFFFTIQADPHLGDDNTNSALYELTLRNALDDAPDFHVDLGDTFMTEKYTSGSYEEALKMALNHRPYFDVIARSAHLFLVNGNHEAELGWNLDGTADNMAVNATLARRYCYPAPAPGGFYSGGSTPEPHIGIRDGYYAWTWGDALFIILDPFWYTTAKPNKSGDCWDWTLGFEQYSWLKDTLEQSGATFKFVFIHNLFGSTAGRGGIETAGYYEWGGLNADNSWGFDVRRTGWAMPIHSLLAENNVSIVFHGHDHFFVKQELDGIVYQLVPQPSHPNFKRANQAEAYGYLSGEVLPNSGHLHVTVCPSEVIVDYVRAYLPEAENSERINGQISHTYRIEHHTDNHVSE
jgi:hypothetical protein